MWKKLRGSSHHFLDHPRMRKIETSMTKIEMDIEIVTELNLDLRYNHSWLRQNVQHISRRFIPAGILTEETDSDSD